MGPRLTIELGMQVNVQKGNVEQITPVQVEPEQRVAVRRRNVRPDR